MCELFGICARENIKANDLLENFYSHCQEHPHGWGLAVFRGHSVSLEKEPVRADESIYLRQRLSWDVTAANLFAHIRQATVGYMNYANCHPFVWDDASGRTWTLMHNGTLFHPEAVQPYAAQQEGTTDSERMLLYLIDHIDRRTEEKGAPLTADERFGVLEKMTAALSDGNKLNLMVYDGEQMYVHTNYAGSLHLWERPGICCFSTRPLFTGSWNPLPLNTLLSFAGGGRTASGTPHGHTYHDKEQDMSMLYAAFSGL